MFRFRIEPVVGDISDCGITVTPYESLGERIRTARDSGVGLPVTNGLEYDTEEDGDEVDPIADPRTDFFDQAEGLDALQAQMLAEEKRQSDVEAAAKLESLSAEQNTEEQTE